MNNNTNITHLDANEVAFFKREIEYVKTKTYEAKFPELKAFSLIPVSNEAPSGTGTIVYRTYTGIGLAKIVNDYAKDFPRVDVYGEEKTAKVKGVGASYGYSIVEIRRSMLAGNNLKETKARMTRRAIEGKINNVAFIGDSATGLQGLINYPGITEYTVPADGTNNSSLWSKKSATQILRDMNGIVGAIITATNGVEKPTTLLLPPDQYLYIASTKVSEYSDKTILQYFLETQSAMGGVKKVDFVNELKGAGVDGKDRMIAYVQDEEHLTLEIPQPFEQFEPEKRGLEYVVDCYAETGGVIVYYPTSVAYGDGI